MYLENFSVWLVHIWQTWGHTILPGTWKLLIINNFHTRIVNKPNRNWLIRADESQSVNFDRHLTEILSPFEISYQIFIHTLPTYIFLSEIYLTKIVFLEILPYQFLFSNARKLYLIKVSVNRLCWHDLTMISTADQLSTKQKKQATELPHKLLLVNFCFNSLLHTQ